MIPGQLHGSADQLVAAAISATIGSYRNSDPRGHGTREVLNWTGVLTDVRKRMTMNPERDLRHGYAAAKVCWDLGERDDPESIVWWNPAGKWYIDQVPVRDQTELVPVFWGESYGKRFMPHLKEQLTMVRQDPETRRAWVPIWNPDDVSYAVASRDKLTGANLISLQNPTLSYKNIPCCLGFGMRLKPGQGTELWELDIQVVMRSQSVGVLPYDVFLFATLLELIANELEVQPGHLIWHALSLHVYNSEIERRRKELTRWQMHRDWTPEPMPALPFTLREAQHYLPRAMDFVSDGHKLGKSDIEIVSDLKSLREGALDPISELLILHPPR